MQRIYRNYQPVLTQAHHKTVLENAPRSLATFVITASYVINTRRIRVNCPRSGMSLIDLDRSVYFANEEVGGVEPDGAG